MNSNTLLQDREESIEKQDYIGWHIHVDAQKVSKSFEQLLDSLGFFRDDFIPDTGEHSPEIHWTWKGLLREQASEFRAIVKKLEEFLEEQPYDLTGYIEAEYIPLDEDIPDAPYAAIATPFRLQLTKLLGAFRESEVHISMDADTSKPELINQLQAMGFFPVKIPKPAENRIAIVLTAQGSRKIIADLIPSLEAFLHKAGGTHKASIKEERIVFYWISPHGDIRMPPVIDQIVIQ